MRYLLCLITTAVLAATADVTLTVDKLVDFVRSSIQMKKPDKKLSDYLHHVKLTQKLDDQTIADLQAMGAGPKTIAGLKELGETSAKLPDALTAPPKAIPAVIPDPDAVEQSKIIEEARNYVMNYTRQLPNFMCLEVVRREVDPTGTGGRWHHVDTDTIRVSYFEHHEDYQVVSVNDQPVTNKTIGQLSGAVSKGEFGSMMKEIFEPESHARFSWAYWTSLRGRLPTCSITTSNRCTRSTVSPLRRPRPLSPPIVVTFSSIRTRRWSQRSRWPLTTYRPRSRSAGFTARWITISPRLATPNFCCR